MKDTSKDPEDEDVDLAAATEQVCNYIEAVYVCVYHLAVFSSSK